MEKQRFRCKHCGKLKLQRVMGQKYCSEKACQQARRNTWRREKYAEDSDYRQNQQASTAAWLSSQGGAAAYYREYRSRRKAMCLSKARDCGEDQSEKLPSSDLTGIEKDCPDSCDLPVGANRDASSGEFRLKSGLYKICPSRGFPGANRDAFWAKILVIPDGSVTVANIYPVDFCSKFVDDRGHETGEKTDRHITDSGRAGTSNRGRIQLRATSIFIGWFPGESDAL